METPKTLREAIQRAMQGPLDSQISDRVYWAVRDFLAKRFGAAMLACTGETSDKIHKLFNLIIVDSKFTYQKESEEDVD